MFRLRTTILMTLVLVLSLMVSACGGAAPAAPAASTPAAAAAPATAEGATEPAAAATEAAPAATPATTDTTATTQAAGGASGEKVTLLMWDQFTQETDAIATKIIENFTAKHPNIEVRREAMTLDQLRATANTALASGTGPDIVYHDVTPGRELFRAGLVVGLDDYAKQYGWRERLYPAGLQWTLVDGKLTGLGLEYEFVGTFYNKTLIEELGLQIPTTLDETLAFCKAAKEKGKIPFSITTGAGWPNYFYFTMPVHNVVGVEKTTSLLFEGQGSWNTPEMLRAVNVFYTDMKAAGCFPDDPNGLDWDGARDLIYTGEALGMPMGTWVVGDILQNAKKEHEFVMAPFPGIDGNQNRVYTAGMGSAFFISSKSKHPAEAAMLLDYLFSEEAVKVWVEEARFIPPVPADTSGMDLPPLFRFVVDTLKAAGTGTGDVKLGYNVDLLVPQEFNTMMEDGFQGVMAGSKTPEEQLADLQKIWEGRRK